MTRAAQTYDATVVGSSFAGLAAAGRNFPARALLGECFPFHLADSTAGGIFVVGDAAGQCPPLTGEGIRPALFFDQEAGRYAWAVPEGTASREAALGRAPGPPWRSRRADRALERFQLWAVGGPLGVVGTAGRVCACEPFTRRFEAVSWEVADPDTLEARPGTPPSSTLAAPCGATGPEIMAPRRVAAADPGTTAVPLEDGEER